MAKRIETKSGDIGYRDQLDRARRFVARAESVADNDGVELQDMMYSFFQHCWHIKDWLLNDPLVDSSVKQAVKTAAQKSHVLNVCQDLCNGTKHLELDRPNSGTGARSSHVSYKMYLAPPGLDIPNEIDLMVQDGRGNLVSGKHLARDCLAEWERILSAHGLAIAQRS